MILRGEGGDKEIILGFDGVEELAKKAINPDRRTKYDTLNEIKSQMNRISPAKSGWVLMRKEVIPGSRNQNFEHQKALLKDGFEVPKLMDAILLNILTFVSQGNCLYGKNPWTFTRCQERFNYYPAVVGGFDPSGLDVYSSSSVNDGVSLSGTWKFQV